jgi:endonuclease YncB( thermonuclease family)
MFLVRKLRLRSAQANGILLAAAAFAAGLAADSLLAPADSDRRAIPVPERQPVRASLRDGHPALVLRVIDGDTFEARVRVWPGMDVTTKVRLRGIDAPEMRARCDEERAKALAARETLAEMLDEGSVAITGVRQDKYGGRVDAAVSTAGTSDVADALLARGLVRAYAGRRRQSWCG